MPPPSSSSVATFRYDDSRLDDFYEQCIAPYIPEQLQADIEAVEGQRSTSSSLELAIPSNCASRARMEP